ncbi:MAG: gamma-glutamyltranspeptidase periplasmic precursor [Acidimicrobiaceae bacterium]|nr:gamma-glutamyltranspeptidase periplasmic precursor [Acidimicrobiaceae bacterium]
MAMGLRVAVSSPHLLASQAAIDALRSGGNAVDAAVAAAAVATVVQPFSSSVGGVGWATVYERSTKTTEVLQFNGSVPAGLDPDVFRPDASGLVDWRFLEGKGGALLGSLVPGAVAGWEELLARKGRWPLARALERAVDLATEGFPVSELLHDVLERSTARLRRWPASAGIFLADDCALRAGERLVQRDLGATLERIARNGSDEITTGETGRALVELHRSHGGALSAADLAAYRPSWHAPLVTTYRGHVVHSAPAPLGDVSFVSGLQLLDAFPTFGDPLEPDYIHASVESAKLVSADRARYLGADTDPSVIDWLLGAEHVRSQRQRIGRRALASGTPLRAPEDTITLVVVDADGNAVHLMQTVGTLFGTAAVAGRTGMLANSSLYFAYAGTDGANRVIPGQGIEQNPCLATVLDAEGELELVIGSPGGKTRVETVRQMLANVFDFGMNVQQAVDAPRFLSASDGSSVDFERRYGRVDARLRSALEDRGHRVEDSDELFGSGQAIAIDRATGTRMAAADWRRESVALAY